MKSYCLRNGIVIAMIATTSLALAACDNFGFKDSGPESESPELSETEAMILDAVSAAPPSISAEATVLGYPAEPGGKMPVLREGSNGWTCLPDAPDAPGSAMCLDAPWLAWMDAWQNNREPEYTTMGFGYMLQRPGYGESNTDPYATEPTDDNEWIEQGVPHVMILVPDHKQLEGLPTAHDNGGPWVMWKDTPYAHIMAPMPEYVPEDGVSH